MARLIAILNVVVWSGFWAFGYLALTAQHERETLVALILAALGGAAGLWTWLWLVRHSEAAGYAPRPRRAFPKSDSEGEAF
jgi:H+/Cl- antiporter ClcA